jgi:hypothetical protein
MYIQKTPENIRFEIEKIKDSVPMERIPLE